MILKKLTLLFAAAILAVTLAACENAPETVSETAGTAFENQTIMPKVAETERERPVKELDEEEYDEGEYIEARENGEYRYDVYSNHIVLTLYLGEDAALEIPESIDGLRVTEISVSTFSNKAITSVIIPDGVVRIGKYAFLGCKDLSEITVPDSVKTIERQAFADCESLEKIVLPESVTEIGESVFSKCSSLKEINLPNGIEKIPDWTFYACQSLTKIEIPESVKEIGEFAFSGCMSLADVSMPENVEFEDYAFDSTQWLDSQPQPVIINNRLIKWDTAEGDVVIPDGVERICGGALFNCCEITSISMPNSVKAIGGSAFQACISLKSVTISDKAEIIENFAFKGCEALEKIIIPESVTEIQYDAFMECRNLKNVTVPESFSEEQLKDAFGDTYWYKKRCDETFVEFRENDQYEYDVYENHIAIRECFEYEEQFEIPAEIDGISVTEIGDSVFEFGGITEVSIPNSITKIGSSAFAYTDITEAVIPDSVTEIGEGAFSYCYELADVTISDNFDEDTVKAAFEGTPWYEEKYGE